MIDTSAELNTEGRIVLDVSRSPGIYSATVPHRTRAIYAFHCAGQGSVSGWLGTGTGVITPFRAFWQSGFLHNRRMGGPSNFAWVKMKVSYCGHLSFGNSRTFVNAVFMWAKYDGSECGSNKMPSVEASCGLAVPSLWKPEQSQART